MKTKKREFNKKRRGGVLALVLTIAVCLAIIGFGMMQLGFGSRFISAKTTSGITAREAADAGITEAVYLLNQKLLVWPRDFTDLPTATDLVLNPVSSQPTYSYEVLPSDANNPGFYNGFTVHSTGIYRDQLKKVHAVTTLQTYWAGIGVRLNADINSKTVFGCIPEGSDAVFSIRTNSTEPGAINLAPNTEITGEIVVGPGGDPESVITDKKTSVIDGPTYAASELLDFPFMPVPSEVVTSAFPPSAGGITTITAGMYEFPPITIKNGEKVYIEGNVTISTGDVRINNGGEIRVLSGGSLALYVDGSFIADTDSYIFNEDLDATKLKIYGSPDCTQVIIKNSGDLWAAVYAPNATLEIKNSGVTYGGFVGSSLIMKNSGEFYFDTRLLESVEDPAYFEIERWWEEN